MSAASTSALSSLLSALNNGNAGINVADTVAAIISAESAPEQNWQSQQSALSSQTAEIQQLESEASAVTDSLQSLTDVEGPLSSVTATSSNSAVLTATAAAGTASGSHTVIVNSLATTGAWYSAEETSSSATLNSGSFSITVSGTPTSFTIGPGDNTLTELASSINSAGIGVAASVVSDANGARLSLVAQNSGSAADFTVSNSPSLSFTQSVQGADASITVDGVPVTSASNTVSGAISGVTLNLETASSSPVTVSTGADPSSIESSVSSFVSAYNTLITDLNKQFTYSTSTSSEGVLASDSVARSLQNDVLGAANLTVGTGAMNTLQSLGITTNQDGTLSLDTSTLDSALSSNPQAVADFFQGANGTAGFATTFVNTLNNYIDPSQGAFTVDLQSISNENQDLQSQINNFQTYLSSQQTLLTTEYNNANIALEQLPQTIKNTQVLLGDYSSSSSS